MKEETLKIIATLIEASVAKSVEAAVKEVVPKIVNGKIDKLSDSLAQHVEHDKEWKNELTTKISPAILAFERGNAGYNLFLMFGKILIPTGIICGMAYAALHAIKQGDFRGFLRVIFSK